MTGAEIAAAYDGAAARWRRGAAGVYARLAAALVARTPVPVVGACVLDVGAGTGAAGTAALAAGAASVVAVDLAPRMLGLGDPRIHATGADAAQLPFRDGAFDLAVAALSLGHLPVPGQALGEMRRVAGAALASAFAPGWTHPAKAAVDEAMAAFGFAEPGWYSRMKQESEPLVNDAAALTDLARAAGFASVRVTPVEVDSGLDSPASIVAWRFGMAHLAPFVDGLAPDQQEQARAAAEAAVIGTGPVVIPILALSAS